MIIKLSAGPITCHATDHCAQFSTGVPLEVLTEPGVEDVAQVLGLSPTDIVLHMHSLTTGRLGFEFTITTARDSDTLSTTTLDIEALRRFAKKHPQTGGFVVQYVYIRSEGNVHARMFAPLDNITEDAATGSAAATLGALLVKCSSSPQEFAICQGDDMGRPGHMEVSAEAAQLTIGGSAVAVMQE